VHHAPIVAAGFRFARIHRSLADTPDASVRLIVQARIMRADAAHSLGDDALATTLLAEAARVTLGAEDSASIADDLARSMSCGSP